MEGEERLPIYPRALPVSSVKKIVVCAPKLMSIPKGWLFAVGDTVFCVICSQNDRASRDDTTDRSNAANLVGIVFREPEVVRPEEDKTGRLTGVRRSR